MGGQDHLHRHLWCTAWIGTGSSPALQETTFDRKQQKLIGELFTGRLDVRHLAQLNGLTHRLPIACPQLDALHGSPPCTPRIAWFLYDLVLRRDRISMSTFPQRRSICQDWRNLRRLTVPSDGSPPAMSW